jgi:hypothetical protein
VARNGWPRPGEGPWRRSRWTGWRLTCAGCAELEDTETRAGLTAKNHRVQALRGAYLDVLAVACHRMDVPPPRGGDRARLAEIYRAEEALRHRGLHVRQPTAH